MKLRLTSRIILFSVFMAAALLAIVAALSYRSGSASLEQAAVSQLMATALEKETAINAWFNERSSDIVEIGEQADIVEKVRALLTQPPASAAARSARAALLQEFRPHLRNPDAAYLELFLIDPHDGKVLLSTNVREEGKIKAGRAYFTHGKTEVYVQGPYLVTDPDRPLITAAMPLRTPGDEGVLAVLAVRWSLMPIAAIAQRRTGLNQTEDAFLVNAEQYPLTQPRFIREPVVLQRKLDTEAVRRCAQRKSGVVLAEDYRGVPSIAVCRWNEERHMGIIVKIDKAEALAPARAFGKSIAWFSVAGLLLAAALAFALARTITRPLRVLRERVQGFAWGEGPPPKIETSEDEVGRLAQAFQQMNARVVEQTTQLTATNEVLRRQQTELRVLFDLMPAMIWFKDTENNILRVNQRAADAAGKTVAQIEGKSSLEIYPQQAAGFYVDDLVVIQSGRPKLGIIELLPGAQGEEIWVRTDKVPYRNQEGVVIGIVVMAQDITASKQMEAARDRLIDILESTTDLVSIADPTGKLLYLNRAGRVLLGVGQDEDITQSVIPNFLPDPDHHPILTEGIPTAVREGRWRGEAVLLSRSGLTFPVSQVILAHKSEDGTLQVLSTIMRDITASKEAEQQLRLAAGALASIAEGVLIADTDSKIVFANKAFALATGYEPEEAIGRTPAFLQSGRQDAAFYAQMWHSVVTHGHWQGEVWDRHKNGDIFPVLLSLSTMRNQQGAVTHYVSVLSDISTSKHYQAQLEHQAHHDALTQLPNRLLFRMRLDAALTRAGRSGKKLALLFLDLDRFKIINDTLGHSVGDELLRQVSQRLAEVVRETDTVARFGGDEFALLLDILDATGDAANVAQKILDVLAQSFLIDHQELYISASIGISIFPDDAEDIETLFKNADNAMYRAKAGGRNTYRFFSSSDADAQAIERLELSNDLRGAVAHHELYLEFQPRFNIKTGAICGLEALARWRHPMRGNIPPAVFIPIAEQTGQMEYIGDWVLREACRQIRAWHDTGLNVHHVAVNLSALQFARTDLAGEIMAIMQEFQIAPAMLELEITESVIMSNADGASRALKTLNEMGLLISIDDFGTGYSSLSYLKRFPVSYLKIDQSFIAGVCANADDAAIARAIIALAKSLGLRLIAEGVETEGQYAFLKREDCDEAQGFLLSRPLPATELAALLVKSELDIKYVE